MRDANNLVAFDGSLNQRACDFIQQLEPSLALNRIKKYELSCGAIIYDFGVNTTGSIAAGIALARICMADLASVSIAPQNTALIPLPQIQVLTDMPIASCLAAQYAGWPVKAEKYFAMGSGPMRIHRGREKLLDDIQASDSSHQAVGVLESEVLPDDAVARQIAIECKVQPRNLILCVAPTSSISGTIQIVARSVETAMHQLHELGADLSVVQSAVGFAPIPPPGRNFMSSLGRTNDSILYGSSVTMWVTAKSEFFDLVHQIPSNTSREWGRPFAEIFAACGHDFYKIDPLLFAPAVVTVIDITTGRSMTAGELRSDCLIESFATETVS